MVKDTHPQVVQLIFIVFLSFSFRVAISDELCHPSCFCLDTFFECRKRGLTSFPSDFPVWVKKLNLSNNEISSIDRRSVSHLVHLEAISLDSNNFSSLPNLGGLPNLVQLSIANNLISAIDSSALSSLYRLEELDVSRNRIETLHNSSFPKNWPLSVLNLGANYIEVILPGWMYALEELVSLDVSKNKLRSLPKDAFSKLKRLETLDLSSNKLGTIDSLRFQELKDLKVLSLKGNQMTNLSDAAFYGLEKLEHLYLDENNIKVVEKRWLYGLRSLKSLNLSNNNIGRIDDESWEFLEELEILDLNTNGIESISRRSMMGLSNLKLLDLSFNRINEIAEDTFVTLESLEVLDMHHNSLTWVIEDVAGPFKGLKNCHTLNLADNKIRSLHPDALQGLPNLMSINLSANPIKWLSERAFLELPRTTLVLHGVDTLVCDCQSNWLRSRLISAYASNKSRNRHRDRDSRRRGGKKANKEKEKEQEIISPFCSFPPTLSKQSLVSVGAENLSCIDPPRQPLFIEQPKSEVFLMDGNGSLTCTARAQDNSLLTLMWRKDRKDLPNQLETYVSNMHRMEDNGATTIQSTLQLTNVSWNFAGTYQCVAENYFGVVYSVVSNVTVHVFPNFIKKPTNVTVRLGSNAKLECAAKGFPTPEIAFQKDGGEDFPAALDRRFHVMPNDDSFFIMEVKVSDTGVYCCSARNAAGEVKACVTVVVYDTPSFSDPMEDESAVEGNNAILACLARGSPKPMISWNKEGVLIAEGKGQRFHLTENGSLLVIKDVQLEDAGRYECALTNAVGTARGFSTLSVIPNPAGKSLHLDTSAMTIIFIIIAVFCVVGTSAAWVVVIYRTRKRNKAAKARRPKYAEDDNRPDFPGPPFGTACRIPKAVCPDADSQSLSGKDSGTGDDMPLEVEGGVVVDVEHESLMRPGTRKKEMESFSTFGTTRACPSRISQVRLDLHTDMADVITLATPSGSGNTAKRITKVAVPVPPDKDKQAGRHSACPSNASSSGYSSSGTRVGPSKSIPDSKDRSDSLNSVVESLQDGRGTEEEQGETLEEAEVTCVSTAV